MLPLRNMRSTSPGKYVEKNQAYEATFPFVRPILTFFPWDDARHVVGKPPHITGNTLNSSVVPKSHTAEEKNYNGTLLQPEN